MSAFRTLTVRGTCRRCHALWEHNRSQKRSWGRHLSSGESLAGQSLYEMSLELIKQDGIRKTAKLQALQRQLDSQTSTQMSQEEIKLVKKEIEKLEVQTQINDPSVRANFKNALRARDESPKQTANQPFPASDSTQEAPYIGDLIDLSSPVNRHLLREAFQKYSSFPSSRILQRVEQMNVIPDCLEMTAESLRANIQGSLDMFLNGVNVEVGSKVPLEFLEHPESIRLEPLVFHEQPRSYTLALVDPDAPELETESYTTFLHMLIPNISLSATHLKLDLGSVSVKDQIPYIPPHAAKGTAFHRYTWMLFEQPEEASVPLPENIPNGATGDISAFPRFGFDLDGYVAQHRLVLRAIHFVRAQHPSQDDLTSPSPEKDALVSRIYSKYYNGQPEPHFVRPRQAIRRLFKAGIPSKRYEDPAKEEQI